MNKNKNLRYSFLDGTFASAMTGFTQDYFIPFLLLLGGTAKAVGALVALPNLFASLVQLKSADVTEHLRSRKRIITIFVLLQALSLIPMVFLALWGKGQVSYFVWAVVLFTCLGAFATAAWGSFMSDLVDKDKWGQYFGWRNKRIGFITVAATFLAGFILHQMEKLNIYYGFALIFSGAFLFRILSWYFLKQMHEPPLEYDRKHQFSFFDFVSRVRESNFAQFVFFVALMNFSVNLASPFFAVFMLRELNFSYIVYTVITIASSLAIYAIIGRWGRLADKVGNLHILRFTTPIISIIPLLWIVYHGPLYLLFAQIISGFAWAGFNLCASNFIYDAVSPPKRTRCISYFNIVNGLALACGAFLGGALLHRLPPLFGYKILTLFLISSLLRLIVAFSLPRRLREVRVVPKVKSTELFFSMIGIKPLLGIERKTVQY